MSPLVVLITGASSGIGRAAAKHFAKNGYRVAADRMAATPNAVASEILRAAQAPFKLRRPVGFSARLHSRLRRFLPTGPLDQSLRKTLALN
jgi:NAD(P)-dependent dehydrogenase (short-subunit alcohol dehydrogenase family)